MVHDTEERAILYGITEMIKLISLKVYKYFSKGQILRSTPNTAPLICGACNTQPEGLLTTA